MMLLVKTIFSKFESRKDILQKVKIHLEIGEVFSLTCLTEDLLTFTIKRPDLLDDPFYH